MNVLHINGCFGSGGAALAAGSLAEALRAAGHGSRMLVAEPRVESEHVATLAPASPLGWFSFHAVNQLGLNYAGILGTRTITRHPFFVDANVVNLHNLHGGYFNYLALPRLSRARPLVWTLHDMWALTGHCAHSFDCTRWQTTCGHCPYPRTYPPVRIDATRLELRIKRAVYARTALTIVCPSRWLAELARQSVLRHFPIHHVPNGVDTATYRPLPRDEARRALGLPADRHVLLFVSAGKHSPYKPAGVLKGILAELPADLRERAVLAVLGDDGPIDATGGDKRPPTLAGLPVHALGYVAEPRLKARIYSAADILLYPSRADNQPLVILEALACGLPVVASNVGGIGELVVTDKTGCLVPPGDARAFRDGIARLLVYPTVRRRCGQAGRRLVERDHRLDLMTARMLVVYETARAGHDAELK